MSDNKIDNNGFDEAFRKHFEGVEVAPSAALWDRVEASVDGGAHKGLLYRALQWSGAIAAALLVGVAANFVLSEEATISSSSEVYDARIAEFLDLPQLPFEVDPIIIGEAQRGLIAENVVSSSVSDFASDLDEMPPIEGELESASSTTKTSTKEAVTDVRESWEAKDVDYSKPIKLRKENRLELAMALSGGASSSITNKPSTTPYLGNSAANGYAILSSPKMQQEPTRIDHHTPLSYRLSAAYYLSKRWSIESGISYTRLNSDITKAQPEHTIRQRVDYIGVPIRLNYNFLSMKNFSLYAGAGAQAERCISATLHGEKIEENKWQISLEGALGAQYNITNWLSVYAEPEVAYYLKPTKLTTSRSKTPANFKMQVGLRFRIQ